MSYHGWRLDGEPMNEPLIVIDMQECFVWRNHNKEYDDAIDNVAREIKAAVGRNEYILFVEMYSRRHEIYSNRPCTGSPTLWELRELVRDYDKIIYVYKIGNDGGDEIIQTLIEKDIPYTSIKVCGAYTDACVSETVQTLSIKLKENQIKLVKDAVVSYHGCNWGQEVSIAYMTSMGNVSLA